MSRLEFMKQLARLLDDLPREEKIEILKYYNGYFDDAGVENEASIVQELGSPEKVAAEVKAGMAWDLDGDQTAASHENVSQAPVRRKKRNHWVTLAAVAVLLLTFPVWIGLLGGLLGLVGGLLGLFGGVIGLVVSVVVWVISALIGLVNGVVGCIVGGIGLLLTAPVTGMLSLAVGIFLLGLLVLVGLLVGLIFGKIVPGIVGGIGKLIRGAGKAIGGIFDGIMGRG